MPSGPSMPQILSLHCWRIQVLNLSQSREGQNDSWDALWCMRSGPRRMPTEFTTRHQTFVRASRREVSRCYLCPFSLIRVSRRSVTGSRLLDMVSSNPTGMPLGSDDRSNGCSRNEEDRSRVRLP
jgi:hypothetical protein